MTNYHSTAPTLLVAIDIFKHRHEVLIDVPGKKRRRRMTILNTLDDFQRLVTALASYELPVRIGFEATGNYHRDLAHHLGQAGFDMKLVSSVGLARTREALRIARWRGVVPAGTLITMIGAHSDSISELSMVINRGERICDSSRPFPTQQLP